ncbi:DEAD/DEAH box helicase [Mycoplasmatota bacterium]|nr:DEAD/DEAH box helicase [Mycoplasmatota bacterium]
MSFEQFHFKPFINEALKSLNFTSPKPIQKEVIPLILNNKSVVGQSKTGSGKTHAFLLPLFQQIEPLGKVQVVITSPTRELAKQIYDMAIDIAKYSEEPYKIKLYVGGTDREKELSWLNSNQPDIVIGTPGRLWDYAIKERKLLIHQTKYFIVDEADMTLESGFLKEIDNIAGTMPDNLLMCVFSATIPDGLKPFLNKYMNKPIYINLIKGNLTPLKLTHYLIKTKGKNKNKLLLNLMHTQNPYLAIIFANTKKEVAEIATFLTENNFKVGQIHGDLTSRERARMMRDIRDLRYTYIVATDIAARGIDIEGVSHIINYSLPLDEEFYIHRCGRTSRNNLSGVVYSFYDFDDDFYLNKLESKQIKFNQVDVKKGEIVKTKSRNRRKEFIKEVINKQVKVKTPKPKKVKPNYKKKLKRKLKNRK